MAISKDNIGQWDKQPWNKNIGTNRKAVIDGEVGSPPKPIRKIVDLRNESPVKPGEMLEDEKFTQT